MEIGADVGDAVEFSGNDDGNNSYHIIAFAYGVYIDHRGDAIAAHHPYWRIVKKAEPAKTLRDEFAMIAGDPPSEFVSAYKDANPMGRIQYTYGYADEDRSRRKHDLTLIAKYQADMRAAWALVYADAMMEARKQ